MGIEVSYVIPVKSIPKTTSGKVQRYVLREMYINGEFDALKTEINTLLEEYINTKEIELPVNQIEQTLMEMWCKILDLQRVGTTDNFFSIGGDSLKATGLISQIREVFKVNIDHTQLFESKDIKTLAAFIIENENTEQYELIPKYDLKDDRLPLSFSQQRLWFLNNLDKNTSQYNLYSAMRLQGDLREEILEESLNSIMQKHEILRVSFSEEGGQPFQRIHKNISFKLSVIDLCNKDQDKRIEKAMEMAEMEAARPFDLNEAPLLRGYLYKICDNDYILLLVVHHIIFDGWSFNILLKELSYYYKSKLSGKKETTLPLEIQYYDYSKWQMERIKTQDYQKQLEYWKNKLGQDLPFLELPTDKKRQSIQTYNGKKIIRNIPDEIVIKVKELAKKQDATLYMVLLAAYNVLLERYTDQEDIIIGTPIANRNRKDIENIIGFFTNNIVLRTTFSKGITFDQLLNIVKRTTLEAYSNQDIPFEKLVEELKVKRDMSRNPIFQVLFGLQKTTIPQEGIYGVVIESLDIDNQCARFDLSLDLWETEEGLKAIFEYNTDLFHEDTVSKMLEHYCMLLQDIVNSPRKKIENLNMLSKKEKDKVLYEWNKTESELENVSNWVQLFENQVRKNPEAIAVMESERKIANLTHSYNKEVDSIDTNTRTMVSENCDNKTSLLNGITYKELDNKANQLARYLLSKGTGEDNIIGVYMNRTIEMVVAFLAIHKAGAAFLPMDPIFPKERLVYMLEHTKAPVIITDSYSVAGLPQNSAKVINIDEDWGEISEYENIAPKKDYKLNNLAYVIYTSGSTGVPKGVQIEQLSLINFLLSMSRDIGLKDSDSLLAVTTVSFDIAYLELFLPLICGSKIVLASREEVLDGELLAEKIDRHNITVMQATPATWRLMLNSDWKGKSGFSVLCGGEALPQDLANGLINKCDVIFNLYGPTETTIWSTLYKITSQQEKILVGKPISNTKIYVLDEDKNPVPVGLPGELYIGGQGVARGYLHDSELTKEKFIPNPFIENERIYKTGDKVLFTKDGNLEFIGRVDYQVKIRGFRIELGEIEIKLNQYDHVKESVVLVKELSEGNHSLVAYIIPSEKDKISVKHLREYLKTRLPEYMIPSVFVPLEQFPMTPNKKIDRKALPVPQGVDLLLKEPLKAADSKVEKILVEIWKEILKIDTVGVNNNFFDLGGHSLLLTQMRSKIKDKLNKEISVLKLFEYPTISTLAKYLELGDDEKPALKDSINNESYTDDIAVIGLSGRFPAASDIKEFWDNLCNGREGIAKLTDDEIISEGIDEELLRNPSYVKAWGVLKDVDKFDAKFFGFTPREAKLLDPQQRVFLEEAWSALESSGYDAEKYHGLIGVFASVGMNNYIQNIYASSNNEGLANSYQIMISNDKDFIATRVAYKMNLRGPAVTVQTACSSSLVAVHMACQSLMNGECNMALAGGVSIRLPQKKGYLYQEGMILSPDGSCRAFDDDSKGTIGGNGAGVVVLKRLKDAIKDGDCISAVIKGTAINNDGGLKVGYTAPKIEGQREVIALAHKKAKVNAQTITYVEAHGTGTPLGDPIEIEALKSAFEISTQRKGYCAIGSCKTNIGHLDSAAGITGFIKTVLSLKNKMLPPSINFDKPNKSIDFMDSPFYVNTSLSEWKRGKTPLRAGVSSFGIGGTNAHVILEEAPDLDYKESLANKESLDNRFNKNASPDSDCKESLVSKVNKDDLLDLDNKESLDNKFNKDDSPCLLILSAKSMSALEKITDNLLTYIKQNEENLRDIAYTLQVGRKAFEFRRFLVCSSTEDAIQILENRNTSHSDKVHTNQIKDSNEKQIFNNLHSEGYTLETIGNGWISGAKVEWEELYKEEQRRRVVLPTYPFERESFWIEKKYKEEKLKPLSEDTKGNRNIKDWFYVPTWKQSLKDVIFNDNKVNESIIVIADKTALSQCIIERLKSISSEVTAIYSDGQNIMNSEFYHEVVGDLVKQGKTPKFILNLLGLTDIGKLEEEIEIQRGKLLFNSQLNICKALGSHEIKENVHMKTVTNGAGLAFRGDITYPEKALVNGTVKVIPREYPNIKCSNIDIGNKFSIDEQFIDQIIGELLFEADEAFVSYTGLDRWSYGFEKISLDEKADAVRLKDKGVYLITGGLGGIGIALAEYLCKKINAKFVFANRSEFPEKEEWQKWITQHGPSHQTSLKIQKLIEFEKMGSEVLVCRTDITNTDQLYSLKEKIIERFGRIDGIIHAAGVPGGGMIQMKNQEMVEKVFAPKVEGTVNLHNTFKDMKLDFFIMCSSLNAITGGYGQVDYSSANAFMDAFAKKNDSIKGTRYISINWERWPETGMAVQKGINYKTTKEIHPLLGRKIMDENNRTIYFSSFSPEKNWVLSEHVVLGVPTVPGTTYIEMIRASVQDLMGDASISIEEIVFLSPLSIPNNNKRNVFTILDKNDKGYTFKIVSKESDGDREPNWQEHVHGRITIAEPLEDNINLEEIINIFKGKEIDFSSLEHKIDENFISFGNRWKSLVSYSHNNDEGLVEAALSKECIDDLNTYKLHPALLDVVTGALRLTSGKSYLPFSYKKIRIYKNITDRVFGYIKYKNEALSSDTISCDISITDQNGILLVQVEDFYMRLIKDSAEDFKNRKKNNTYDYSYLDEFYLKAHENKGMLDEGILPHEGQDVFDLVLKGCYKSQILVSTKNINTAMDEANYIEHLLKKAKEGNEPKKQLHKRPELSNEYIEPKSQTEKKLASIWEELMGVEGIGLNDEFFEIGGDSLLLSELHSKLKDQFETDIAVVDLYKYNTIASLAKKLLNQEETEKPVFEKVNQRVNRQREMINKRREKNIEKRRI